MNPEAGSNSHQGASYASSAGNRSTGPQIAAFATAAAVSAALAGVATYVYFQRRSTTNPQLLLDRCRLAIDEIERGLSSTSA